MDICETEGQVINRLTAENTRLRAEVDTLSAGLCAQADNAVEAQKVEEKLRADLVDAAELHLADEQSIRNLERSLQQAQANALLHASRNVELEADLARVTGERDALLTAAKAYFKASDAFTIADCDSTAEHQASLVLDDAVDAIRAAVEACK